jgi:hypothetical protein
MKVYICYAYYYDSWKLETCFLDEGRAKEWVKERDSGHTCDWSYDYEEMEVE